jgi:cation-transporting ATPase 13A2
MFSMGLLTAINLLVLLSPPKPIALILELMTLPSSGRAMLLLVVIVNMSLSMTYERWGTGAITSVVGWLFRFRRDRRRFRDGKAYKRVEVGVQ